MSWWADLIGVPFAVDGQTREGLHCWGLVRLAYAERLGIDLPTYAEIDAGSHRATAQAMQAGVQANVWRRVEAPRAFDVMVARRDPHSRYPGHVGLMLDPARVLHVWEGRATHVARVTDPSVSGLILGYYRHRSVPCLT